MMVFQEHQQPKEIETPIEIKTGNGTFQEKLMEYIKDNRKVEVGESIEPSY
jgi:hypothetical protein